MRNKMTVIAVTALPASSAAIGATVGILGASPDHQRELGAAIVVGARSGATHPPATATETATARHFFEACVAHDAIRPLQMLCERAASACQEHVAGALEVEVVMVDFEGEAVIARA